MPSLQTAPTPVATRPAIARSTTQRPGVGETGALVQESAFLPLVTPRKLRILVVEDDPTNARVIALMCGLGGYEVHWADSGVAALALLAGVGVDLVLMDVQMPIVDGPETLRLMRASRDLAEMPVVFLTATVREEERARLRALGAAAVLSKPIRRVDLLRCLASLMPAD